MKKPLTKKKVHKIVRGHLVQYTICSAVVATVICMIFLQWTPFQMIRKMRRNKERNELARELWTTKYKQRIVKNKKKYDRKKEDSVAEDTCQKIQ